LGDFTGQAGCQWGNPFSFDSPSRRRYQWLMQDRIDSKTADESKN
jgi:hypothetical protein